MLKRKLYPLFKKEIYCEAHHIKPKSIYPELKRDKSNIVNLTPKEHYIAHRLLIKIYKNKFGIKSKEYRSMLNAFWYLCHASKHKEKISSRTYVKLKEAFAIKVSETQSGVNHWNFGKHHSKETRKKIGKANKGNTWTEERKIKYGREHSGKNNPNYGNYWTEEQKENISKKLTGRKLSKKQCENISKRTKGKLNPMYGKSSWEKCTPEQKADRIARWQSHMKLEYMQGTLGAKWMHDPITLKSTLVKQEKIEEYLNQGYEFGRIFNNPWSKENREKRKKKCS